MSTIPAKEIERSRDDSNGRNHVSVPAAHHHCDGEAAYRITEGGGT
jgi:hypothetical protein